MAFKAAAVHWYMNPWVHRPVLVSPSASALMQASPSGGANLQRAHPR